MTGPKDLVFLAGEEVEKEGEECSPSGCEDTLLDGAGNAPSDFPWLRNDCRRYCI